MTKDPASDLPMLQRLRQQTLVILQPTSFCNIDCSYCYLPGRQDTVQMSPPVLRAVFDKVLASELVQDPVVFLWHLGEPLSVPVSFYEEAFGFAAAAANRYGRKIRHGFQTNATLINSQWIDLIRRHRVVMGVSVDGPAFIHDRVRVNRAGRGTHAAVMRGISQLQAAEIGFAAISVLTDFTLDYPEEFYDFFVEHGINDIAYNIDQVQGTHELSSFAAGPGRDSAAAPDAAIERYERFLLRLLRRADHHDGAVKIREVWNNLAVLALASSEPFNSTNQPLRMINVDQRGDISTFCPELTTAQKADGTGFALGNVLTHSLADIADSPALAEQSSQVAAGVELCRQTCDYWQFCGGGSPSSKFFEHGRFDTSETRTCRVHKKATVDVLLRYLERRAEAG